MQYFGGKQRIAGDIAGIINLLRGNRPYLEPFVGGGNIISRVMGDNRIGADIVPELINMYIALQNGWKPPRRISREEYQRIKADPTPTPLRAFVGFGCSFAGKYFGGYAGQDIRGTQSYAENAANGLEKKLLGLMNVQFCCKSYDTLDPIGYLIYCDPPYAGTTSYSAAGKFCSDTFWATCRKWAANDNIVLVSEYTAPPGIPVIWEKKVKTEIRGTEGRLSRTEKLFMLFGDLV